jgi:hypothetical protein
MAALVEAPLKVDAVGVARHWNTNSQKSAPQSVHYRKLL